MSADTLGEKGVRDLGGPLSDRGMMLGRCRLNVGLRFVDEFRTIAGRVDTTIICFNAKLSRESDFGNPHNVGGRFRFTRHDRYFVSFVDMHNCLQICLALWKLAKRTPYQVG
jgi:hypothetical protein